MSPSEKVDHVADALVLAAGLLLLSWFYYELYQAFLSPPLGF